MAKSEEANPVRQIAQSVYDRTVRDRLPRKLAVLNGVTVRKPRLLDGSDTKPSYKQENVSALREHVQPGDDVTIIGGGFGVTPVIAAQERGTVTVYEPSREHASLVREAASLNDVPGRIHVEKAAVGPAIEVFGAEGSASESRQPSELGECDVLELDCEGAEHDILTALDIQPRVIIVEVHPHQDVSRDTVRRTLRDRGYTITSEEIANEQVGRAVLTAVDREDA